MPLSYPLFYSSSFSFYPPSYPWYISYSFSSSSYPTIPVFCYLYPFSLSSPYLSLSSLPINHFTTPSTLSIFHYPNLYTVPLSYPPFPFYYPFFYFHYLISSSLFSISPNYPSTSPFLSILCLPISSSLPSSNLPMSIDFPFSYLIYLVDFVSLISYSSGLN